MEVDTKPGRLIDGARDLRCPSVRMILDSTFLRVNALDEIPQGGRHELALQKLTPEA